MQSDSDLLRDYIHDSSGPAFTEIVRRNIALVHSCVLRRVGGDTHLAEDVTQRVFTDLARKAPKLTKLTSVAGWLYVAGNLASAETVRKERRRKTRENFASQLSAIVDNEGLQSPEEWSRLRNLLDELICGLDAGDREVVVLRYFSRRSYSEIAGVVGTTEEGARKRVERALVKLRARLESAGVRSSMEALETELAKESATEPPVTLANRVASIALFEFGTASAVTTWCLSLARILTSKAVTTGAVFVGAAFLLVWQHHQNTILKTQIDSLRGQSEVVRQLTLENRKLAMERVTAEDVHRAMAKANGPDAAGTMGLAAVESVGRPLTVSVTSDGRIMWENEPVDLQGFLNRLVASQATDSASETQLLVHGAPGVGFSATAYVVEQASKAGIKNITIDSQASPSPSDGWISATPGPPSAADKTPPTLPDVPTKP
jgi:RNA polymerase sigma factor (sigma-70 family)